MKIIKNGEAYPDPPPPEWVGLQLTCKCGCEFVLEIGDDASVDGYPRKVIYTAERGPDGKRFIELGCPNSKCRTTIRHDFK